MPYDHHHLTFINRIYHCHYAYASVVAVLAWFPICNLFFCPSLFFWHCTCQGHIHCLLVQWFSICVWDNNAVGTKLATSYLFWIDLHWFTPLAISVLAHSLSLSEVCVWSVHWLMNYIVQPPWSCINEQGVQPSELIHLGQTYSHGEAHSSKPAIILVDLTHACSYYVGYNLKETRLAGT